VIDVVERLSGELGFDPPKTAQEIHVFEELLALLEQPPPGAVQWLNLDAGQAAVRSQLAVRAKHQAERLAHLKAVISEELAPDVFALPIQELLERFRTTYRSSFRGLRPQYRRDVKRLSRPGRELAYEQLLAGLDQAAEALELEEWFAAHEPSLQDRLGNSYRGPGSDWPALCAGLDWAERLLTALVGQPIPSQLLRHLQQPSVLQPLVRQARMNLHRLPLPGHRLRL